MRLHLYSKSDSYPFFSPKHLRDPLGHTVDHVESGEPTLTPVFPRFSRIVQPKPPVKTSCVPFSSLFFLFSSFPLFFLLFFLFLDPSSIRCRVGAMEQASIAAREIVSLESIGAFDYGRGLEPDNWEILGDREAAASRNILPCRALARAFREYVARLQYPV